MNFRKRKAVNSDGIELKPCQLYGFFATITDTTSGLKVGGGEIPLQGYVLGGTREANAAAGAHKDKLQKQFPNHAISVQKHALELVGPIMQEQYMGAVDAAEFQHQMVFYVAAKMAELQGQQSLELNPNDSIQSRIQVILQDAAQAVNAKMKQLEQERMNALNPATGLVDESGAPIAPSTPGADTEVQPDSQEAAEIAQLQANADAQVSEANAQAEQVTAKILQFPGKGNEEAMAAEPELATV